MAIDTDAEILRLRTALRDLVAFSTIPAAWVGREPPAIAAGLADVLVGSLHLDFAFVRLCDPVGVATVEVMWGDAWKSFPEWLERHTAAVGQFSRKEIIPDPGGGEAPGRGVVIPIGVNAEGGLVAAACGRPGFPDEIDQLLLSVAANHAATAFQSARLIHERRSAEEALQQARAQLEIKVAERTAELRRSEAYLAEAQRLSHTGSYGWNASSGEIYWSEETFRIFEYDPANKPTMELALRRTHPEERALVQQVIKRVVQERKDFEFEHRLLMPGGRVKFLQVVIHALEKDEPGNFEFIGAVLDITERKHAEEELLLAQAELAHVTRLTTLGELMASIAHEVNQPLAAVSLNANACLRWLAGEAPNLVESRQAMGRIVKEAKRAGDVIGRIRALAKKTPPRKEPSDINEVLLEAIALARSELRRNRVDLHTRLAEGLPRVLADRVQLQQVILNLIINGIEAMSGAGVERRELLISSARPEDGVVEVGVRDSGVGLDSKNLDQLFDAFYTTKQDGMGMGLSISRSIIEAHGGRLWATASKPSGAAFQFTLPVDGEE